MAEVQVAEHEETAEAVDQDEEFEYPQGEGRHDDDGSDLEQPAGNGKKTLAELAAEAPEPEGDDEELEEQPRLFGTEDKITAAVKGKRPEDSAIKFKAAQTLVKGQFHFDDVVELRVLATLDKVEFVGKRDRNGKLVSVKRVHHASATSVEQVNLPPELLRRRLEFVAAELGVDADALAAAQERAAVEVE